MGDKNEDARFEKDEQEAVKQAFLQPEGLPTEHTIIVPTEKIEIKLLKQKPKRVASVKFRISHFYLSVKETLYSQIFREVDQRTPFNWLPVFFAIGCLIYFTAPAEPVLLVLIASAVIFSVSAWRQVFHGKFFYVLMALAMIFAGMTVAKIQTITVATPIIERQLTTQISGVVLSVSKNTRGAPRYLIRPINAEEIENDNLPRKIRLSAASKHTHILPGEVISGLARLYPFSGPAYPGGYDFSFNAWFQGIGRTGFFMGRPTLSKNTADLSSSEQFTVIINRIRGAIEQRLRSAIPGESGDIAVALITGNRTGLDEDTQKSLRKSGLAHILAISGLHMALVTLTVVWMVRAILALVPYLVLRYPVHKWAALAGFTAASSYLVISGAGIATQRAWIMISVMLLSTLMDRRAITMRSVAIAALIILALAPNSLLSPGFQMSFAAVAALVASYEALRKWREHKHKNLGTNSKIHSLVTSLWRYVLGLGFSSLIAGTATALFAAYHFHQIAPMGLFANLGALPIVSLAVMPLALSSMLLMPYGLESLTLSPLAIAIEWVVGVSDWINSFEAPGVTGILPTGFLGLGVLSLLLMTLLKTKLRLLGLALLLPLPFLLGTQQAPNIIIAETGRAIAVKNSEGNLELLYPRRNRFVTDIWKKAWPVFDSKPTKKMNRANCNKEQCVVILSNGKKLYVVYNPELLKPACMAADILVAPRLWWINCHHRKPDLILKRHDFEQYGTHAIYFKHTSKTNSEHYRIERALPNKRRPWNRQVSAKL